MRHATIVRENIEFSNPRVLLEPGNLVNHLRRRANKGPLLLHQLVIGELGEGLAGHRRIEPVPGLVQFLFRVTDEIEGFGRIGQEIEERGLTLPTNLALQERTPENLR